MSRKWPKKREICVKVYPRKLVLLRYYKNPWQKFLGKIPGKNSKLNKEI